MRSSAICHGIAVDNVVGAGVSRRPIRTSHGAILSIVASNVCRSTALVLNILKEVKEAFGRLSSFANSIAKKPQASEESGLPEYEGK